MIRNADQIYDELLVLRSQSGDRDSLSILIQRYRKRLLQHAFRLTGQAHAAEDIVQEALVNVIRSITSLKDPAVFRSWVYRITTNKCRDWQRRQQRLSEEPINTEYPTKSDAPDEGVNGLTSALADLGSDHQVVISMFYLEGMSLVEIAEGLDLPVGTVKSRLHHARQKLKKIVDGG